MTAAEFSEVIQNPGNITAESTEALAKIISKYSFV